MRFEITKNQKTHKFNQHWRFSVGSDHAPMVLWSRYAEQLSFIHKELGIRYVRFHGIFSDDMEVMNDFSQIFPIPGAEKYRELNFRRIAEVYDQVLRCGMKPFVELSFMPKQIASGDEKCFFYYGPKNNISQPAEPEKWAELIRSYLAFLMHRYGKEEVESWYFEVWNEPDLGGFFAGSKEDYFRFYELTARTIKEVDEKLRVGGPATSGSKWIHGFLEYCGEKKVPVDFVSTHQYAGDPVGMIDVEGKLEEQEEAFEFHMPEHPFEGLPEGSSVLTALQFLMADKSETEDVPDNGIRDNAAIVKQQAKGLPVIYTEWNENGIFAAASNDTRKVPAFDIRAVLDTEKSIDFSSIWCFSDLFEEFHLFPEEFHGGFGMLTASGIPKPLFYGMKLLTLVGEERIELSEDATAGEIGIGAFRSEIGVQVLLFRQKMKNLDLPKERAEISVELSGDPEEVSLYRIDEEHCNPLAIWKELGSPAIPTPAEKEEIIRRSSLQKETPEYTYQEGSLTLSAELGVNDIFLFTIRE